MPARACAIGPISPVCSTITSRSRSSVRNTSPGSAKIRPMSRSPMSAASRARCSAPTAGQLNEASPSPPPRPHRPREHRRPAGHGSSHVRHGLTGRGDEQRLKIRSAKGAARRTRRGRGDHPGPPQPSGAYRTTRPLLNSAFHKYPSASTVDPSGKPGTAVATNGCACPIAPASASNSYRWIAYRSRSAK